MVEQMILQCLKIKGTGNWYFPFLFAFVGMGADAFNQTVIAVQKDFTAIHYLDRLLRCPH